MANISQPKLLELIHAAECWAVELEQYIIPASEQHGDEDSAESQKAELEGIETAVEAARAAIREG